RSPCRNLSRAARISRPYVSAFFSPIPETSKRSLKDFGCRRQISSKEESCSTTTAATPANSPSDPHPKAHRPQPQLSAPLLSVPTLFSQPLAFPSTPQRSRTN